MALFFFSYKFKSIFIAQLRTDNRWTDFRRDVSVIGRHGNDIVYIRILPSSWVISCAWGVQKQINKKIQVVGKRIHIWRSVKIFIVAFLVLVRWSKSNKAEVTEKISRSFDFNVQMINGCRLKGLLNWENTCLFSDDI